MVLPLRLVFCKDLRIDSDLSFIQGVPLATEPGISLIILTRMKILQRNLNSSTFLSFTFSFTFLTQWGQSASNLLAISSLVVKLLTFKNRASYI
jgi:hypothetical protein